MNAYDRFKAAVIAVIHEALPELPFSGIYSYNVARCSGGTFDGTPSDSKFGLPPAKNWPVRPSVLGGVATLPIGSSVAVAFINRDPSLPFVIAFSSGTSPTSLTWDAGLIVINGGVQGVARVGDTVQAGPYSGVITSGSATVKVGG